MSRSDITKVKTGDVNSNGNTWVNGAWRSKESIAKRKAKRKVHDASPKSLKRKRDSQRKLYNGKPEVRAKELQKRKKYSRDNREKLNEYRRKLRADNKETYNEYNRKYYKDNRSHCLNRIYLSRVERDPFYGLKTLVRKLSTGECSLNYVTGRVSKALDQIITSCDQRF